MGERYKSWLKQAEHDLRWGEDSLTHGHYAQTCFIAQQVSEKALKALAFFRGFDFVKGHSLNKLAQELKLDAALGKDLRTLDLYYFASRYPDALPDHEIPTESFDMDQGREALELARRVLATVQDLLK